MTDILIQNQKETADGWQFSVQVQPSTGGAREYTVHVNEEYYDELTGGDVEPAELVRESFRYLLERESPGAIMREFSLADIATYFPAYPEEIGRQL